MSDEPILGGESPRAPRPQPAPEAGGEKPSSPAAERPSAAQITASPEAGAAATPGSPSGDQAERDPAPAGAVPEPSPAAVAPAMYSASPAGWAPGYAGGPATPHWAPQMPPQHPFAGMSPPMQPYGVPAPAMQGYSAAQPNWYWCPNCKLASSRPGNCVGCKNPYVPAPPWGVPGQPFLPAQEKSRGIVSILVSVLAALLVVCGVAGGIALLAAHGQPIASTDQSSSGGGGSSGSTNPTSTFQVGSLKGTLKLPGVWTTDATVATPTRNLATSVAAGAGGNITVDVSVRKGQADVAIVDFATTDPASVLTQFQTPTATTQVDSSGDKITFAVSRTIKIAGFNAVAQDYEVHNPAGAMTVKGTFYAVNAGDHAVIIRAAAGPAQAPKDLPAVESALVAIG